MAPRPSIFDYDVSVSADKQRRQRRRGMSGAFETSTRRCEHPGCDAEAHDYRHKTRGRKFTTFSELRRDEEACGERHTQQQILEVFALDFPKPSTPLNIQRSR